MNGHLTVFGAALIAAAAAALGFAPATASDAFRPGLHLAPVSLPALVQTAATRHASTAARSLIDASGQRNFYPKKERP